MVNFVRNELKRMQRVLTSGHQESQSEEIEQETTSREAFLQLTIDFLRRRNQEELADLLQNSKRINVHYTFP